MDRPLNNQLLNRTALLLCTGALAFCLAACGSGDDDPGTGGSTTAEKNGTTSELTPRKDAPDSAGDRSGNAPDDVISDRPGGGGGPEKPAQP